MNLNFNSKKESVKTSFRLLLQGILIITNIKTYAQNVGINATGVSPNNSAMLDIVSTTSGLLIPRVTLTSNTDATTIASGNVTSLLVYNTTAAGAGSAAVYPGYYYWNGAKWIAFTGNGGNNWALLGNTGITNPAAPATYGTSTFGATENWMGTTDANDVVFGTNNLERMRIMQTTGNVGIGTAAPAAKLSFPDLTSTNADGMTWWSGSPLSYGIFKTAGTWSGPNYQQLSLAWQTGIVINGGSAYGLSGTVLQPSGGNVGIGITTPGQVLDVYGKFQVNSSGDAVKIKNVPYSWPASQGAASTVLSDDGAGNLSWKTVAAVGGNNMFSGFQVFTANGTFTLPPGVTKIMVEVWGGGGGGAGSCTYSGCTGGGAGCGGGSGGFFKGLVTVSSNLAIVVGGVGSAGAASGGGGVGGLSSITGTGVAISVNGGNGGTIYSGAGPGSGGAVTSTTGSIAGCTWSVAGYPGYWPVGGGDGGRGGTSPQGGQGGGNGYIPGQTGSSPGGGGAGSEGDSGCAANHAGGAGAMGTVIIWW